MTDSRELERKLFELKNRLKAAIADRSFDHLSQAMHAGAWVYGAGNFGRKIAGLIEAAGYVCHGFIDQKGDRIKEIGGLPVVTPSEFTPANADGRSFILGVLNSGVDAEDILPFTDRLPFAARLWNADLPELLGPEANSFWLSSRSFLLENFDAVEKVARALYDDVSRETYLALVLNRITGKRADYPAYDRSSQYLPPDLPGFSRPIVFVDGGAYTGDTGKMLLQNGVAMRSWMAFEPDEFNFRKLVATVKASGVQSALFPCGLADSLRQVCFEGEMGVHSHITSSGAKGGRFVQCIAFDDVLPGTIPDFIKLDVEGSEISALNGMVHTITKNAPRLAVSAYHNPQDLWEIPLKLTELAPSARLHIRQHDANGFETVAYAIP